MDTDDLYIKLKEITSRLGIEIRYDKGNLDSSYCMLKGRKIIILNTMMNRSEQNEFILEVLRKEDLTGIYILPAIRDLLDEF